ncbi:MAG: protein translocase subunit SecF [Coriobacteriia bacterium]|nr:protein translocase subunit SecF [Coriobacteriia bacterium]
MRRSNIDFLGNKKWLFAISAVLIVVSIGSLAIRGLVFGIEFQGGTVMTFAAASDVTTDEMRGALEAADVPNAANATIQPTDDGGFIVRTAEGDADVANAAFGAVVTELGLSEQDINVTTIGPGWGKNITEKALYAFAASILAILAYISLRFEYKMSVTAVIALVHDVIITLGIYSLFGREFTPNTMAALLTILGYSLYDTIVVFHRIRENSQRLVKQTFQQMANDSINQVLVRSINTSLTSLIPVICLVAFGGSTLKDFAFALLIGMISGAYSSIGVASPIYALWKEREPKFQALKKKYERHAA